MMVRGSVDGVTATEVRGWAYGPGRREPVLVQALLNHEILGEALADIHRPDLAAAGLGDGNSGYVINLYRLIDPLYMPFVVVKVDGGDAELPRAPMLGFGDFFTSLYAAHPAAGRSRSVYGGLWTDRTDAAALLRGKTAIGQVQAESANAVAHLIHHGLAVVNLALNNFESMRRKDLPEQIGDLLDNVELLPILRTVLEDNPIAMNAEWLRDAPTALTQPSSNNPSPSPTECLDLVITFDDGVVIDVVRASHCLPEFTPSGISRWTQVSDEVLRVAALSRLMDCYALKPGYAAMIGPGTLYRVRYEAGNVALRMLCLASRGLPLSIAINTERNYDVRPSGAQVWV